jgi:hypothetical protein
VIVTSPFDNEIDFHSFLFVIRSKSVLFEIINFCLTQTAEFRGYRSSGQDHVLDFVRIRTSFLGAFECMKIDLNVHFDRVSESLIYPWPGINIEF